jgi:hypothetical protein
MDINNVYSENHKKTHKHTVGKIRSFSTLKQVVRTVPTVNKRSAISYSYQHHVFCLAQVHSLFQSEFPTECDLVLPL